MKEIKCRFINLADIESRKIKINTNNYHHDYYGGKRDENKYRELIDQTSYLNYIHLIQSIKHIIIPITRNEKEILGRVCKIGIFTDKISEIYEEEVEEIIERIDKKIPKTNEPYFFRTSHCSAKDSIHGLGPVYNARDIILRLVTSQRCLKNLEDDENTYLILKPWLNLNRAYEFRVFIFNGEITAISQYYCYEDYGWEEKLEKIDIQEIYEKIDGLYHKLKKCYDNCVMDIYLNTETNEAELIEFNSFGMEMASGSALFEWIADKRQLYGETNCIEFRFVNGRGKK